MRPHLRLDRPEHRLRALCFDLAGHSKFEWFITGMIIANTLFMASFHADQPDGWDLTLRIANFFFLAVFTLEAAIKITAWQRAYFKDPANSFDFIIVVGSLLTLTIPNSIRLGAQVARVFRVFRILRFASRSPGIRSLFRTLRLSIPSMANLLLLLFLALFIFAVIGTQVRER